MKKLFISLVALTGFSAIEKVNAQEGFSYTIKATPQFSFLANKDDNDDSRYETKATFNVSAGIGLAYNFTNQLGVGVDLLYSLQGQKYTLSGVEYNQNNEYIKLPLYFTYNSNPLRPVSFIGKIGPQVSFITNSKLEDEDSKTIIDNTKNLYTSATLGGAALAGVQFKLGPSSFLTTLARFDHDFTNAEDDAYSNYVKDRAKTYNTTAGIEIGLKFMLH